MCACGSDSSQARSTPPSSSNANVTSRRRDAKGAASKAAAAQLERDRLGEPEPLSDLRLDALLPAQDPLGLPVGQPRSAADHRPVERRLAELQVRVEGHLDGDAEAVLPRTQAAEIVGKLRRQHRRHPAGDVEGEGALRRAAVERRAGGDEVRDVGDVHPGSIAVSLAADRDRVVEVLGRVGVDRETDLLAEVDAAVEARGRRVVRLEVRPRPLLLEQRLEDVREPVCRPERLLEPGAPSPRGDDGKVAGPDVAEPALVQRERHAGREVRLADEEAPAPSNLDDESVGQTLRKRRRVRPEPAAPSSESETEEDQRDQPEAERLDVRVARQPREQRRQRRLLAHEEQDHGEQRPDQAADQALEHERTADEPVRGPDELHHLDLAASREDREPDRVRDQDRGGGEEHEHGDPEDRVDDVRHAKDPLRLLLPVRHVVNAVRVGARPRSGADGGRDLLHIFGLRRVHRPRRAERVVRKVVAEDVGALAAHLAEALLGRDELDALLVDAGILLRSTTHRVHLLRRGVPVVEDLDHEARLDVVAPRARVGREGDHEPEQEHPDQDGHRRCDRRREVRSDRAHRLAQHHLEPHSDA